MKDTKKILSRRKDENVVIQNNERMILNKDMEDTMLQRKDVLSREGSTRTRFKEKVSNYSQNNADICNLKELH